MGVILSSFLPATSPPSSLRAISLPRSPWGLLQGPTTVRLYSLSLCSRVGHWLQESFGGISVSSAVGAGFTSMEKIDKSLQPYIDYHGLNEITVKNRYLLLLISSAFELLQGATVFTKLDLCNGYHLVHILKGDEWKMVFNTATGHYEYLVMPN